MRIFGSHLMKYGAGFSLSTGSRLVRELAMAKILGPDALGLWAGMAIYRQYSAYSDLGFTNGLGRVLPMTLSAGRTDEARSTMGMAWAAAMAATVVFALITIIAFLQSDAASNPLVAWGVAAIIGLIFLDKQFLYVSMILRSTGRVGTAGLWMGALGVAELAISLALAPVFGLAGLYVALVAAGVITTALMIVTQPLRARLHYDRAAFRQLTAASFLLMGFGLTTVALHNIDRVAIAQGLGAGAELGQYHLASTLSLIVNLLPYVVVSVISPEIFRFTSAHRLELRRYVLLPTVMVSTLGVAVIAAASIALPPLLAWMFPDYVAVPLLVGALMVAELFFSIAMVSDNIVVALDRGTRGLVIRWTIIALGFAASVLLLRAGYGLGAVALAMCAMQLAGAVVIGSMAAHGTGVPIARYLAIAFAPVLYGAAVLGGTAAIFGEPGTPVMVFARGAVVVVALLPLAVVPLGYFGRGPMARPRATAFLYARASE